MKKYVIVPLGIALMATSYSCKKDVYGCKDSTALNYSTEATKDDGSCILPSDVSSASNNVVIEEFWVDFSPGVYYDSYSPSFIKEPGDVMIVEVSSTWISNTNYWTALPYNLGVNNAYMFAEYTSSGFIWVETNYEDGTPANWTGNMSYLMRVALIKKNGLLLDPDLKNKTIDELKAML